MSDKDDDDLFGGDSDGGDTDDLIAEANKKPAIVTKKKKPKRLQKKATTSNTRKETIPDADNDNDDDDDSNDNGNDNSNDNDKGLFDESDEEQPTLQLSKRERMEALQKKKRATATTTSTTKDKSANSNKKKPTETTDYDSGDSYESDSNFQRTKEDNDFIDMDGDDEDAIQELYSEQHFDDERPDGSDDDEPRSKKRKVGEYSNRRKSPDAVSDDEGGDGEPDNPIMAAVHKMKKKKREQKKLGDLEEEAKDFIATMEHCADEDLEAIKAKRPATKKIVFLPKVVEMLTRRDMMRLLLDMDVLTACKRWIQPLPNGTLGNVTVRNRIIETVAGMTGEQGIMAHDLKRSEFGKVVMGLYMHKQETSTLKRDLKKLIERWSRPIFQKSGNMKDLEHVHESRGGQGLAAMNKMNHASTPAAPSKNSKRNEQDLKSLIASGSKAGHEKALNRVRVPYSAGFQYTVRPQNKTGTVADKRMIKPGAPKDNRGNLSKRMVEKTRVVAKNQRSANMSVEGRVIK